jgi:hypothetical protein
VSAGAETKLKEKFLSVDCSGFARLCANFRSHSPTPIVLTLTLPLGAQPNPKRPLEPIVIENARNCYASSTKPSYSHLYTHAFAS